MPLAAGCPPAAAWRGAPAPLCPSPPPPPPAIVPITAQAADGSVPLFRLLAEHAISINTAAAGGNASLMTLD